ncbi:hypothetical protein TRFO_40705 [Tritrichomonas foetus]|uniref:Uncharacterized protein n=1 Tax=Tritrichomonas foetus TaxID=1144522 RepID=A0A1J4J5S0_9EUKA|nr:hypothetical protein TRFO_40705 [Tritrichomonas foetus]|eukprot:OHS92995.1 hypothetical protein TRFO_40705 [Tritrichomonas foetus]
MTKLSGKFYFQFFFVNSMKHASNVNPIFNLENLAQVNFISFVENNIFILWKHPTANYIISFILFGILTAESFISIVRSESTRRVESSNFYDVLFYITTWTLENPTSRETNISFLAAVLVCISYAIIILLTLINKAVNFPFLRGLFCFFIYYFTPIVFVGVCNCFMEKYTEENGIGAFWVFVHCIFLAIIVFIVISNISCPIYLNYPLFIIRPIQSAVISLYFILFIHFALSSVVWIFYVRVITSVAIFIYTIVFPPYLNKYLNFFFYFFNITEIVNSLLTITLDRLNRILYSSIALPVIFILSAVLAKTTFWISYKITGTSRKILHFYTKTKEQCKKSIESVNISKLSHTDNRILLIIALHLHCNNMFDLINKYKNQVNNLFEVWFAWISTSRMNSHYEHVDQRLLIQINKFENNIEKQNNFFWSNVLESNTYILPEIAGLIGREKYRLLKYSSFLSVKFPKVEFPEEVIRHRDNSFCSKIVPFLGWLDLLVFIAFCSFLVGHSLILSSGYGHVDFVNGFFALRNFSSSLCLVYSDIWDIKYHKDINTKWKNMISSFEQLQTHQFMMKNPYILSFVNDFHDVEPKLHFFLEDLQKTHSLDQSLIYYPEKEMSDFYSTLDDVLNDGYSVVTETDNQAITKYKLYILIICLLFPVLTFVIVIIYLNHIKKQTILFFDSFRTADKNHIRQFCQNPTKFAHVTKFTMSKAFPGTVMYSVFVFVSIIIFVLAILFNFFNFESNHKQIRYICYSFSMIQRIILWLVSGVTHYSFKDYLPNSETKYINSLKKCDLLYDQAKRNVTLTEMIEILPVQVFDMIGQILINDKMESYSKWHDILNNLAADLHNKTLDYTYLDHYYISRNIAILLCVLLLYALIICILLVVSPFAQAERQEYIKKAKEARIIHKYVPHKIKEVHVPLVFVVINPQLRILYASGEARSKKYIAGNKLSTNGVVDNEIEKYKSQINQETTEIISEKSIYYIVPFYDFSQKDVKFDHALVVIRNETTSNIAEDVYNDLFHIIFPKTVEKSSVFPVCVPSVMKQFIFIIIKINGFNDWADEAQADVCMNYRTQFSKIVINICKENEYFCRIRESSDSVILAMKHESKSMNLLFKVLDSAAELSSQLKKLINSLNDDFNVDFDLTIMLYKTVEPHMYLTLEYMQLSDYKSDAIFRAEEFAQNCVPNILNYTSQAKERMMVPNTTKINVSHTSNGEEYDIFLVV